MPEHPKLIVPRDEIRRINQMRHERAVEKATRQAREFDERVSDGRASYASMVSRVWSEAHRTLKMVEDASESQLPLLKRTAALRDIAKLLPTLHKAERNKGTLIARKAVEDMSEDELAHLAKRELKRKARS